MPEVRIDEFPCIFPASRELAPTITACRRAGGEAGSPGFIFDALGGIGTRYRH